MNGITVKRALQNLCRWPVLLGESPLCQGTWPVSHTHRRHFPRVKPAVLRCGGLPPLCPHWKGSQVSPINQGSPKCCSLSVIDTLLERCSCKVCRHQSRLECRDLTLYNPWGVTISQYERQCLTVSPPGKMSLKTKTMNLKGTQAIMTFIRIQP